MPGGTRKGKLLTGTTLAKHCFERGTAQVPFQLPTMGWSGCGLTPHIRNAARRMALPPAWTARLRRKLGFATVLVPLPVGAWFEGGCGPAAVRYLHKTRLRGHGASRIQIWPVPLRLLPHDSGRPMRPLRVRVVTVSRTIEGYLVVTATPARATVLASARSS